MKLAFRNLRIQGTISSAYILYTCNVIFMSNTIGNFKCDNNIIVVVVVVVDVVLVYPCGVLPLFTIFSQRGLRIKVSFYLSHTKEAEKCCVWFPYTIYRYRRYLHKVHACKQRTKGLGNVSKYIYSRGWVIKYITIHVFRTPHHSHSLNGDIFHVLVIHIVWCDGYIMVRVYLPYLMLVVT